MCHSTAQNDGLTGGHTWPLRSQPETRRWAKASTSAATNKQRRLRLMIRPPFPPRHQKGAARPCVVIREHSRHYRARISDPRRLRKRRSHGDYQRCCNRPCRATPGRPRVTMLKGLILDCTKDRRFEEAMRKRFSQVEFSTGRRFEFLVRRNYIDADFPLKAMVRCIVYSKHRRFVGSAFPGS
jgi:hypothetical protein